MAVLVFLVLFLSMTGHLSEATYCVCKDGVAATALQKALDYACGAGADCGQILQNGPCFNPNTVKAHCDYAVNSYFQKKGQTSQSCDFAGAATTSSTAPSAYGSCVYPSSPGNTGNPSTNVPSTNTPGTSTSTSTTPGTSTSTTPGISTTPGSATTPVFNNGGLGPTGSGFGTDTSAAAAVFIRKPNWVLSSPLIAAAVCIFPGLALLW